MVLTCGDLRASEENPNFHIGSRACYALAPSSPGPFSHAMRASQLRWGKGSDHPRYVPLPVYVGEGRLAEAERRKQGEGQSRHQSTSHALAGLPSASGVLFPSSSAFL